MIKLFSLNKIFYLINDKKLYNAKNDNILIDINSAEEMRLTYKEHVQKSHLNEIYFFNKKLEQLFDHFASMFRIIEAAGGLVQNIDGDFLFIFRYGKWDLPKGKIEKGEAIKTAAIREVEEECGISKLTIVKELPVIYHTYSIKDQAILKRTYWFEMLCTDTATLVPQTEEGITDVRWIAKSDLKQVFDNTYESIKEVLKDIGK